MLRFQLEVAIVLVASSLASFSIFCFTFLKQGAVQLPEDVHQSDETSLSRLEVTTEVDFVDGYPIDSAKFWGEIRWRKLGLLLLFGVILSVNGISTGWAVVNADILQVIVWGLHLAFSVYLTFLVVFSMSTDIAQDHSSFTIHLATLTGFASALLGLAAILPAPPLVSGASVDVGLLRTLRFSRLILYALAFLTSVTIPLGPPLHYPPENIYPEKTVKSITNLEKENVSGHLSASIWQILFFSYITKVVQLGNTAASFEVGDLPIVAAHLRSTVNYANMKKATQEMHLRIGRWSPKQGSGLNLWYRLLKLNASIIALGAVLSVAAACLSFVPAIFLQRFITFLEKDPSRQDIVWGWIFAAGIFFSSVLLFLVNGQLWSISTATAIQVRFRTQLNSILFAKTLVRKDISSTTTETNSGDESETLLTGKAQVMTLMTIDVDRVSQFSGESFDLVGSVVQALIGSIFLYKILGISCFFGLALICLFLPVNHYAGIAAVGAQDGLMKVRDKRLSLMNEILNGIRTIKFMAWERRFETEVMKIRRKELQYQKLHYLMETLWMVIWNGSPILVILVTFWHYAVVRGKALTPAIAFTSVIFNEIKYALNALPEQFINLLQTSVSLRRIEMYLEAEEIASYSLIEPQSDRIAFESCTVAWPCARPLGDSGSPSSSELSTPNQQFALRNLTFEFPVGELSLICGKLGSGKTLMLLALLGEGEILAGQAISPRSRPDVLASFIGVHPTKGEWVVKGVCAYVPQSSWLQNASIKDNILFNVPLDEERYQQTLHVCALVNDLDALEDGDQTEVGERGINLSGGQKARVSLARAVYSRASILFLDDVLSAVDAYTARYIYHECLKGSLMQGRTVILVSHNIQLCAPGASYIVALDNGHVVFNGDSESFQASEIRRTLDRVIDAEQEDLAERSDPRQDSTSDSTMTKPTNLALSPRKFVENEKRAVGRISRDVWEAYIWAFGDCWHWTLFLSALILASLGPIFENGWLRHWSDMPPRGDSGSPVFHLVVYGSICFISLIISTVRWLLLYDGSIHASRVLYRRLLKAVLFANIRFHDTVSRGSLLNRFGKDFEVIDSNLSDHFGRTMVYGFSVITSLITISVVGGPLFIFALLVLCAIYYDAAKIYGRTARDMRRLHSVTSSPLYSIYGEAIAGATVIRAFGASSKFLRDMLRNLDTNTNTYYWMWGVNKWQSIRFNCLSSCVIGVTAVVSLITPSITASFAGFALAFAFTITNDMLFMVRRFVGLEQAMVALERVKEYSDIEQEPPEYIQPRPPATWPEDGAITFENLSVRYAPELPNVLHELNFTVRPGEKIGILGRTGSGKSTLALSLFRLVEVSQGRILVDGTDIADVGITDLRGRLSIISQDPILLGGTLRSMLDGFREYEDEELYEALRRVCLLNSHTEDAENNRNIFQNLETPIAEGGGNLSTGQKQLLCIARAIIRRSKIIVMDEATASVDYATDEIIGATIRSEFSNSTILTIAHRVRTVIDYDRVMVLDAGRIVEFDSPSVLLRDQNSKFYKLCEASGKDEFVILKRMAGV